MKKIKTILLLITCVMCLPLMVKAGAIRFNNPVKTSENTYEFTLTIENMNLNYISGNLKITNGIITKINMSSSWINKTGNNNNFYFYHNGRSSGSYKVATIEVTMTDNSEYTAQNIKYGLNKCTIDDYGNYFGENGSIVSEAVYNTTCRISKDASLKQLSANEGKLSPLFESTLELYNMTVENKVDRITFEASPNNSKTKVISGLSCSLKVGVNLCKITTQAEAGNQKTYTITVIRKNNNNNILSSDASISNLEVHGGSLTKKFSPNTKEYDIKVDKKAKSIYFTFITNSNKQKYTSKPCSITEDTKTCKLTVTAEDGVTQNSYVFHLLHENASSNANSNNSGNNNSSNTTSNSNTSSSTKEPNKNTTSDSKVEITDKNENTGNKGTIENPDIETNKTENNSNQNTENKEQEVQNEEETIKENNIKIPFINKDVNKTIIFIVIDFLLGITIGLVLAKCYKKWKKSQK